jgi:hypothetical protein
MRSGLPPRTPQLQRLWHSAIFEPGRANSIHTVQLACSCTILSCYQQILSAAFSGFESKAVCAMACALGLNATFLCRFAVDLVATLPLYWLLFESPWVRVVRLLVIVRNGMDSSSATRVTKSFMLLGLQMHVQVRPGPPASSIISVLQTLSRHRPGSQLAVLTPYHILLTDSTNGALPLLATILVPHRLLCFAHDCVE